jgi:DUF917 family protein
LITGKVVDLVRRTTGGFARGGHPRRHRPRRGAHRRGPRAEREPAAIEDDRAIAVVPDLIVLLDEATGIAVPTERVRFGQRLTAIGLPCAPIWRSPGGLAVAGPMAFGFPHPFVPVEELAHG